MQNNPIAMSLYTLGKTLLKTTVTSPSESMHYLSSSPFCNVAFADNFTGCWKLESFKQQKETDLVLSLGTILGSFIGYRSFIVDPTKT